MKYSAEERIEIGRQIYTDEITKADAANTYGISVNMAREYMRLYRDANSLPPKNQRTRSAIIPSVHINNSDLEDLESMTKDELIREVVKARIAEARLKKGYEVKGDGSVILYDKKNIK